MDKAACRRSCFDRIKSISAGAKRTCSQAICDHIAASPAFNEASIIFSFISLPSEPDLSHLSLVYPEKRWAFPKVRSGDGLAFHTVSSRDDLKPGALGLLEPDPARSELLRPDQAHLILVPGVSFDPITRARLGRGKGYYDRFLASTLVGEKKPVFIGVCFSIQFSAIETEPHDIPMHRLVTEQGWVN
ncbi:MAG: 5-formyltetrahydrofolate cyclo-ligase [Verrucomicrobiales bacterium]|nr:5-formyltetrahydrofolate cyclo-ligase [Verrucomicrobiales bacterium]